ncbi:hypothetical protein [Fusibacter ferrireducens]|uniref:Uncharacterized protein n=1 Tax=Fusibacter ferrireducens TaxID=2785058 RepID=A0ABR9ZSV9_9FIRM|nr:hypothetical protein [Fusibacter ferrireducens]MBF4693046.1 hypothetical protein [Fusibacter ferrireducens]
MSIFTLGLYLGLFVANYFKKNTLGLLVKQSMLIKGLLLVAIIATGLFVGHLEFDNVFVLSAYLHFFMGLVMGITMQFSILIVFNLRKEGQ